MNLNSLTNYCFETQYLKQLKRSGLTMLHVDHPDSVAEHALLATQLAFFISELEGTNTARVVEMMLFHDNSETRIGDINKVQERYLCNKHEAEHQALDDQLKNLPIKIANKLKHNFEEMEIRETPEAKVAYDADKLELAFFIRILQAKGQTGIETWLENIEKSLHTKTALALFAELNQVPPHNWIRQSKKMI